MDLKEELETREKLRLVTAESRAKQEEMTDKSDELEQEDSDSPQSSGLKDSEPGTNPPAINGFELQSLIGSGGMGRVFMARQEQVEKPLAIKLLHNELANDPVNVKRFRQEVKAASMLTHVNLATVYSSGTTEEGVPYLVMDYIDGQTLESLLKTEAYIETDRFYDIFLQVTEALSHAHSKNVIHRDLKPANIMLVPGEHGHELVKLLDFGIARVCELVTAHGARVTQTGEVIGSPVYMSPEQCLGKKLESTADIYSLGVVMYEALTGRPPFSGENSIQVIVKHINEKPARISEIRPDLNISPALEDLIMQMLDKDPEKRPLSMQEVWNRLANARKDSERSSTTKQEPKGKEKGKYSFKNENWKRLLGLGLLLVGSSALAYYMDQVVRYCDEALMSPTQRATVGWARQADQGDAAFEHQNYSRAASRWEQALMDRFYWSSDDDEKDKPINDNHGIMLTKSISNKIHKKFEAASNPKEKHALAGLGESIFMRFQWVRQNHPECSIPHQLIDQHRDFAEYLKNQRTLETVLQDSVSLQEEELAQNSPNFKRSDLADAYVRLASMEKMSGHTDLASEYFSKAMEQWRKFDPTKDSLKDLAKNANNTATLLAKANRTNDAKEVLQKATLIANQQNMKQTATELDMTLKKLSL